MCYLTQLSFTCHRLRWGSTQSPRRSKALAKYLAIKVFSFIVGAQADDDDDEQLLLSSPRGHGRIQLVGSRNGRQK